MFAWEFAKALHLQRQHGWTRFVSMQHHYNLIAREEEREMIPMCLDEGVGTRRPHPGGSSPICPWYLPRRARCITAGGEGRVERCRDGSAW
jgi:1-deoxyxylulose-5-phosphate synthase